MLENLSLSLQSIWAHKLRSILTMLGVIIGIAAIISIFSIIEGNTANMKKQIMGGPNNTMNVDFGPASQFSGSMGMGGNGNEKKPNYLPIFTAEQMGQVRQTPGIKNASLTYQKSASIFRGSKSVNSEIKAMDKNYFDMLPQKLTAGRFFTETDYKGQNQVVVLDKTAYENLFPEEDGIGKIVELNGTPFKVIGVVEDPEANNEISSGGGMMTMAMGGGENGKAYVPLTQWPKVAGEINPTPAVIVQGEDTDGLKPAAEKVAMLLNGFIPQSDYVFGIMNLEDFEKQMDEFNRSEFYLLAGIASISLLVGGIGVMNIMLVSVTERTREIGVKKALGARRKVILLQFLTESVTLTFIGGITGILFGLIAGKGITSALNYPYMVSWLAIIGSMAFCSIIGIVFGLMPAIKASKLDPIEALRYD
ncbi:putative ABC transporter (ATP-binding protein) [Carnobacterium maltaromaticum]|nr:ABC transporter permease [Carnobacterium maltaromaticum]CAD5897971.1 putative ABC transporter (ATP-binding protein) [Carnobacterium maltaromaticum]